MAFKGKVSGTQPFCVEMSSQYLFEEFDGDVTKLLEAQLIKLDAKHYEAFQSEALAGAALAAASCNTVRMDALKLICKACAKKLSEFSPASLTKLSWALALAEHCDLELMGKIAEEISVRSWDFEAEELAKCLCAFGELQLRHEAMLMAVALQLMWRIDELSAEGLKRVAVACAHLRFAKQPFFDFLASRISLHPQRTMEQLTAVLWAFAQTKTQSAVLCERVALQAMASELSEEHHVRLLEAFERLQVPARGIACPLFHQSLSGAASICKP